MLNLRQRVFREIEAAVHELRQAVLVRDIVAARRHTARISELLMQVKPLMACANRGTDTTDTNALHLLVRNTLILLNKAKRTTRALKAVYRSILEEAEYSRPEGMS